MYVPENMGSKFWDKNFMKKSTPSPYFWSIKFFHYILYNYHCFNETLKILKHRAPYWLYDKYQHSRRLYLTHIQLIPPSPSPTFIYRSSIHWNILREKLQLRDISESTSTYKNKLKNMLHTNQHAHETIEWLPFDHDINKLTLK